MVFLDDVVCLILMSFIWLFVRWGIRSEWKREELVMFYVVYFISMGYWSWK